MRVYGLLITMVWAGVAGTTIAPAADLLSTTSSAIALAVDQEAAAGFSGSVLVVSGTDVLVDRGIGKIHGYTFGPRSRYWIASAGKQFASTVLLRLQERGILSLTDPISRFVPDAPADKRGITILQLLSHTSGLPQGYEGEAANDGNDAIRRILAVSLVDQPGVAFHYSNDNYQLAAAIAERASGSSYEELLRHYVLQPGGLGDTGLGMAKGYRIAPTIGATPQRLFRRHWGIEGTFSTTHDLLRWYQAVHDGRILSKSSEQLLFNPVVAIQEGHAALGWFWRVTARGEQCLFTRGNDDFGPNALLYAYPSRDIVIVVLSHAGEKPDSTTYSRSMLMALEETLKL